MSEVRRKIKRESFGIKSIDDMMHGGIVIGHVGLLYGNYGSGKTILALQWASQGIREGERVIYVSTDMDLYSLSYLAENLGMNDFLNALKEQKAYIIDPIGLIRLRRSTKQSAFSLSNLIQATKYVIESKLKVKTIERKDGTGKWYDEPIRLIIDRITPFIIGILYRGLSEKVILRSFYRLKAELCRKPITSLIITHTDMNGKPLGYGLEHVCDVVMNVKSEGENFALILEKMRLTPIKKRIVNFKIVEGKGIITLD